MSRAEQVIAFIEQYLVVPEGAHVGQPVKLRPWQKDIITGIYDGSTRRAIVSMGRKNGKTGIIAMLLLAHLVRPRGAAATRRFSRRPSRATRRRWCSRWRPRWSACRPT